MILKNSVDSEKYQLINKLQINAFQKMCIKLHLKSRKSAWDERKQRIEFKQ